MKTTKRYVLTNERDPSEKLRRIKRCVDGELGGFIESEENLPQSENGWVSGNAQVSGDARVSGNARVSGHAQVSGGEWESSPIQIEFCKHFVTNSAPGKITIGCQTHSFSDWLKYYKLIGKRSGYSPTEIQQYGSIIRLIVKIGV